MNSPKTALSFTALPTLVFALTVLVAPHPAQAQPAGIPVRITNPTVPVVGPAHQGFNASCFTGDVDAQFGQAACTLLTIPAGRRVVLESISCHASFAPGQGPGDIQLIVPNPPLAGGAPQNVSHFLALSKQGGGPGGDTWGLTTPLRAYGGSPPGGAVSIGLFFRARPTPSTPQGISCAISGYMVAE